MDKEEAGQRAGEIARARFLQVLEEKRSLEKAALRLHQGLNAKVVKPKWVSIAADDEGNVLSGGWVYSKPLVDHTTRLRAADLVIKAMDVMPDERLRLSADGDLIDAIRELNERHRQRTGDDGPSGA